MIVFTMLLAAFGIAFEHFCHDIPSQNPWCGDKHRNGERETIAHHTSEILFFSKKLLTDFWKLCTITWNNLRNFGNLLLVKIINLFKSIKLRLSKSNSNNNIANQTNGDTRVINIGN
jgi:hypothetical protein